MHHELMHSSRQKSAVGEIVEWLLLVWTVSQAEEWRDRIVYLPRF